jgi:hypothetical protein
MVCGGKIPVVSYVGDPTLRVWKSSTLRIHIDRYGKSIAC